MSDIYYSPKDYGLRTVGEVEFSSGSYEFDTFVVWQDVETGACYYAQDSGCSCPSPFEYVGRDDLTKIGKLQDLIDALDEAKRQSYRYDSKWEATARAEIDADCIALVHAYREAVAR